MGDLNHSELIFQPSHRMAQLRSGKGSYIGVQRRHQNDCELLFYVCNGSEEGGYPIGCYHVILRNAFGTLPAGMGQTDWQADAFCLFFYWKNNNLCLSLHWAFS